jgi:transposase-like protein
VSITPSLNEPVKAARGSKEIQTTVISDRDKGLLNAEKKALPKAS